MKNNLIYILFLFIIVGCGNKTNPVKPDSPYQIGIPCVSASEYYYEDSSATHYCPNQAYFLRGTVGEKSAIEMELWSKKTNADTIFITGKYWYTSLYHTFSLDGYLLTKDRSLHLVYDAGDKSKETFRLSNFNPQATTSGTWTKGDKNLPCTLHAAPSPADFNFLQGVAEIHGLDHIRIKQVEGDMYLQIDQDSIRQNEGKNFVALEVDRFDPQQVVFDFVDSGMSGYGHNIHQWIRLPNTNVPTILYINMERYMDTYEVKDDDGNVLNPHADFSIITRLSLWERKENRWQSTDLTIIDESLSSITNDVPDAAVDAYPGFISAEGEGKVLWVWNGTAFEKKK